MLTFNAKSLNEECLGMQVNVIAGGPSFGKTTLLKALKEKGFTFIPETAEEVIRLAVKARISVVEQRLMDPVGFQLDLLYWTTSSVANVSLSPLATPSWPTPPSSRPWSSANEPALR